MSPIIIVGIALLMAIIGALPLGLVNLSVLEAAFQKGKTPAMRVAHGAAWVEVLYVLTALLAGSIIANIIEHKPFVKYIAVTIPVAIGLFFIAKTSGSKSGKSNNNIGFLKGMTLNLLSIQVLLYWIVALTWIKTSLPSMVDTWSIALFVLSVWIGKMGVLWLYAHYSNFIMSKSDFLSKNINRIIGLVLIATGLFQLIK